MYIAELALENWLPYGGTTVLKLEPTIYAIVAETEEYKERSNWVGKTALFEAPAFVFFGDHRKRTEDEWITNGAKKGSVSVLLSSGDRLTRSRVVGEATKFTVVTSAGNLKAGNEAEEYVARLLKMSKDDYYSMSHYRQGKLSEIVTMEPAARTELFSKWLKLSRLVDAEDLIANAIVELNDERSRAFGVIRAGYEAMKQALDDVEPTSGEPVALTEPAAMVEFCKVGLSKLEYAATQLQKRVNAKNVQVQQLFTQAKSAREYAVNQANAEHRKAYAVEIEKLSSTLPPKRPEIDAKVQDQYEQRSNQIAVLNRDLALARRACKGEFDGKCPVNGSTCPVRDKINAANGEAVTRRDQLTSKCDEAMRVRDKLETTINEIKVQIRSYDEVVTRISTLKSKAEEIRVSNMKAVNPDVLSAYNDARNELESLNMALKDATTHTEQAMAMASKMTEAMDVIANSDKALKITQAARYIFSKQGAQRRIAERVMRRIEMRGNETLRENGIELAFHLAWSRLGKGLATYCRSCGASFPKSERVKMCSCGTARGPLVIDKSEVILSDQSGAANDIVGGVIRLETSAWYRETRGSMWNVTFIDEPYGAVDQYNRHAFSKLLRSMLSNRLGIEQAFVTAHNPEMLTELPGTIRLIRRGKLTRAEVV
jgi:DNA repair exonuclease SbcCD ATPase subunit